MGRPKNPVADRRELIAILRNLRDHAKLSLDDAAHAALDASGAKLSRIETGKQIVSMRDLRDLCLLYGVDEDETARMMALAASARESGWWDDYDVDLDDYVALESAALRVDQFENSVIPGLLQTRTYSEEYVGTIINSALLNPRPQHEAEQIVDIWERRKERVRPDSDVQFTFLLDEAALRRPVGGSAMQAQIQHILEVSTYPNVHIHVLPLSYGGSPGQDGGFTVLTLPDDVPDIVYVESLIGFGLRDSVEDLRRFRYRFEVIHSSCPDQSRTQDELTRIARELEVTSHE